MTHFKTSVAKVIEVNAKLAYAVFLISFAVWAWPDIIRDWQWGFLSVLAGAAGVALLLNAVTLIVKIRNFEREPETFRAQGKEVKSSTLASNSTMEQDGVIRDAN